MHRSTRGFLKWLKFVAQFNSCWSKCGICMKIVSCSQEEMFGNWIVLRIQDELFSERKVDIKDNKHRHEVQLDFFL